MIDFTHEGFGIPLYVPSEHGPLHGTLDLQSGAQGMVVLAHATLALDGRDGALASIFRQSGLSTLSVDLLAAQEEHFPDVHNNVPLLCKRLLDFLGLIKHRTMLGEIAPQPLGLYAANATSPVVIRAAAVRDHDIAAIVCRGGLIDLAGMIYLRSLESPLLMLVEETDTRHIANSRRALQEIPSLKELKLIPEIGFDYAVSPGFEIAAHEAAQWFIKHFAQSR
jgi:putative phosphoribosyl transferase